MSWNNGQDTTVRPASSSYTGFQQRNDASTPQPGMFSLHRRTETAPSIGSTSSSIFYGQQPPPQQAGIGASYQRDEDQLFNFHQPVPSAFQAVRVHQFFPTMGETGVPVTFLMTVKADWARNVGLQLGDRRIGSMPVWSDHTTSRAPSHLVVTFGSIDVETRTERSMAGIDGPSMDSFAFVDGQTDVDLTVVAHAPPYAGSPLSHPSMGGKVSIRIKLVGPMIDPAWEAMAAGVEVGEFSYWQVSPRSNLKRSGAPLIDQPTLRRPASFPNFNTLPIDAASSRDTTTTTTPMASPATKRRGAVEHGHAPRPTLSHHRSQLSMSTLQQQQQQQQQQLYHQPQGGSGTQASSSFNFNPSQINFAPSFVRANFKGSSSSSSQFAAEDEPPRPSQVDTNPPLIRSSQLYQNNVAVPSVASFTSGTVPSSSYDAVGTSSSSPSSSSPPIDPRNVNQRASLELHGDLHDMALGWSHEEWKNGRRLVQFWRKQEGTTIHAVCRPIEQEQYIPNSIVVSCIFWEVTNECYITSVDIIYLLEALVASRFNVEEKNRIRRNLEGLKPKTISKLGKSHDERINAVHESFFKLVMGFSDPRPRHIEKDIKIFPWKVLAPALHKIISKYSAASSASTSPPTQPSISPASSMPSMHHGQGSTSTSSYKQDSVSGNSSVDHSPDQFQSSLRPMQEAGLSIDVAASNSAFQSMQVSSHDTCSSSSFLSPAISPRKGGMLSPTTNNSSNSHNANSGPVNFNFSDFVVSPMAFGQTPMSQSQAQPPSFLTSQQYGRMPNTGAPTGLGMDLGIARRD